MTNGQRRAHLAIWTLLAPLALAIIVIGVTTRRPPPMNPPVQATAFEQHTPGRAMEVTP